MSEKITLTRIKKRVWMSFVMGFPESFGMPEKQACSSLFDASDRVRFGPISPGYDFEYHDTNLKREMNFTIEDTFRRDGYMFLKFLHEHANKNGPHAIGFGYPRIGVDILFIELSQDLNGPAITDAYLMQNMIPVEVSQSQNEDTILDVTVSGFFASNQKVMVLADNYIKAHIAAQKQKEEAVNNSVVEIKEDKEEKQAA